MILTCPKCQNPIHIATPEQTISVICGHCQHRFQFTPSTQAPLEHTPHNNTHAPERTNPPSPSGLYPQNLISTFDGEGLPSSEESWFDVSAALLQKKLAEHAARNAQQYVQTPKPQSGESWFELPITKRTPQGFPKATHQTTHLISELEAWSQEVELPSNDQHVARIDPPMAPPQTRSLAKLPSFNAMNSPETRVPSSYLISNLEQDQESVEAFRHPLPFLEQRHNA
ncbi:MAG: hypothetical protein AAGJ35_05155, partial [Myxococcota bacterium]